MKTKKILLVIPFLFLTIGISCEKDNQEKEQNLPEFNRNSIYTVFELKYGTDTTIIFNNALIRLSLYDVIDSVLVNCALVDFQNPDNEEKTKIHAYLKVTVEEKINNIKVYSKACGALPYNDNGVSDIGDIKNMIEIWKSSPYENYVSEQFFAFGKPTIISNTSYYINMAKAYPIEYKQAEKELYKFIFILWTN